MSRATPDDAQGELQGVLTSAGAIGTIIGPLVFTGLFSWFSAVDAPIYFSGAPYVAAAALDVAALLVIFVTYKKLSRKIDAQEA